MSLFVLGESLIVSTLEDSTINNQLDVWLTFSQYEKSLIVDIRSCGEAHLHLQPFYTEPQSYEVVIGAESNTKTSLYRETSTSVIHSENTPDVLDCLESRTFWISWENGQIDVREESLAGNSLLSWTDTNPLEVHMMALSSGPGSEGAEWIYSINAGRRFNHPKSYND